jgi:quinol monooxygenase YgiN
VSELQGIARFKFDEGKLEEFKRLSAQCMEIVRTKDAGTLQHETYFKTVSAQRWGRRISSGLCPPLA